MDPLRSLWISLDFIVFSYIPIFPYPLWLSLLGHLVVSIVLSLRILLYYHDIPMILYVLHVLLIRCLLYTEVSLAVIKPLMIRPFLLFSMGRLWFSVNTVTFWENLITFCLLLPPLMLLLMSSQPYANQISSSSRSRTVLYILLL